MICLVNRPNIYQLVWQSYANVAQTSTAEKEAAAAATIEAEAFRERTQTEIVAVHF